MPLIISDDNIMLYKYTVSQKRIPSNLWTAYSLSNISSKNYLAMLRGSRPGVQSALLIMMLLLTS